MSIKQYNRARQVDLGRRIMGRHKVYLDACFWIVLRDTELGVRTGAPERKLLHFLMRGVRAGKLICPISASMFLELIKQPFTATRRRATAQMIDELSLGVTVVNPEVLRRTEIHRFLLKAKGETRLFSMQELIWTKVAYVLGEHYPEIPGLNPEAQLELQRKLYDHLWEQPLAAIVDAIGDTGSQGDGFRRLSSETNDQNQKHRDELKSFEGTYDIELRGAIELAAEAVADVLAEMASKEAGRPLQGTPEDRAAVVKVGQNLLYQAMKKPEHRSELRSLHVEAAIHASMRWDKERKFKPNDYFDFQHAAVALSYCDTFLAEVPLHVLVTRPQVSLERVNDCEVISGIGKAADYIRKLVS
ncbi:hypothetical protein ACQKQD_32455 [Methylobacterium sp. NPDC080182]|uniref:hypothetical protein n=1 Tax=Methylobacterium sp. NPDC080182 TaxID=3390590 RepID=UPI003CFE98FE